METFITVGIVVAIIAVVYVVRSKRPKSKKFEGGVGRGENGPGDT